MKSKQADELIQRPETYWHHNKIEVATESTTFLNDTALHLTTYPMQPVNSYYLLKDFKKGALFMLQQSACVAGEKKY